MIAKTVGGEPVSTLVDGKATLSVPGCGPVLVNAGQTGYYRTLYSQAQFDALKGDFAKLAPIDQLGLMGDTWALGMAGQRAGVQRAGAGQGHAGRCRSAGVGRGGR